MRGIRLNIKLGHKFITLALTPGARMAKADGSDEWVEIKDVDF